LYNSLKISVGRLLYGVCALAHVDLMVRAETLSALVLLNRLASVNCGHLARCLNFG
jgi:hypothetical protein